MSVVERQDVVFVDGRIGVTAGAERHLLPRIHPVIIAVPDHIVRRHPDRPVIYELPQLFVVVGRERRAVDVGDEIAAFEPRFGCRRSRRDGLDSQTHHAVGQQCGLHQKDARAIDRLAHRKRGSADGSAALDVGIVILPLTAQPYTVLVIDVVLCGNRVEHRGEKLLVVERVVERQRRERFVPQVVALHVIVHPLIDLPVTAVALLTVTLRLRDPENGRRLVSLKSDRQDRRAGRIGGIGRQAQTQRTFAGAAACGEHAAPVGVGRSRPRPGRRERKHHYAFLGLGGVIVVPARRGDTGSLQHGEGTLVVIAACNAGCNRDKRDKQP